MGGLDVSWGGFGTSTVPAEVFDQLVADQKKERQKHFGSNGISLVLRVSVA